MIFFPESVSIEPQVPWHLWEKPMPLGNPHVSIPGMIRWLEIAQSMMHRPAVLFSDEPSGGLDPIASKSVWDHII